MAGMPYPPTKTPTDCTDVHRLGGYGIPAIPTLPQNYLPTEFTEHTETTGGEYPPPEASVNSVGGLAQTNLEWVLWKEFGGRRGYGRDAIPSYFCENL